MALTPSQQEQIKTVVTEALTVWGAKADDIIDGSTVMFGGNKQRSRRAIYLNALEKGAYVASLDEYVSNKWGTFEEALEALRAELMPRKNTRMHGMGAMMPEWVLEEERQRKAAEEARLFPAGLGQKATFTGTVERQVVAGREAIVLNIGSGVKPEICLKDTKQDGRLGQLVGSKVTVEGIPGSGLPVIFVDSLANISVQPNIHPRKPGGFKP